MPSFHLSHLFQDPLSKYSHILNYWGLGHQNRNLWGQAHASALAQGVSWRYTGHVTSTTQRSKISLGLQIFSKGTKRAINLAELEPGPPFAILCTSSGVSKLLPWPNPRGHHRGHRFVGELILEHSHSTTGCFEDVFSEAAFAESRGHHGGWTGGDAWTFVGNG